MVDVVGLEALLSPLWLDSRWTKAAWMMWLLAAAAAGVLAVMVLLGWLVPEVGARYPSWWALMQPNTALGVLLVSAALLLLRHRILVVIMLLAVLVLAITALLNPFINTDGLHSALDVASVSAVGSNLMSVQTACWLTLAAVIGLVAALRPKWQWLVSLLTVLLIALTALGAIASMLEAVPLLGQSTVRITSAQTAVAFTLLTLSWVAAWQRWGQWRPILEHGIASTSLRWLITGAVAVPVSAGMMWQLLVARTDVSAPVAAAIAASFVLIAAVVGSILLFTRMRRLESTIRHQAVLDGPTQLVNQGAYWHFGQTLLERARRSGEPACVLVFDLDGLKRVNDRYGHEQGTELIATFARALRKATRTSDLVARIGGDEFAVLAIGDPDQAANRIPDRIHQALHTDPTANTHPWHVAFSHGAATLSPEDSLEDATRRADERMYEHKRARRKPTPATTEPSRPQPTSVGP